MTIWMALVGVALAADLTVQPGDDLATLTASLAAGDTVRFEGGTYTLASTLSVTGQGTADAPIRLEAISGATPVLELATGGGGSVLTIYDSSFFELSGLTLRVAGNFGEDRTNALRVQNSTDVTVTGCDLGPVTATVAYLPQNNSRVTFTDNELHDTVDGGGLYLGCSDASCWTADSEFSRNWIHDLGGESSIGITLSHGTQGVTLADNVVAHVGGVGVTLGSTEHGDSNVVEGNAIFDVGDDGLQIFGAAVVRNNVVFMCLDEGIRSYDPDRGTYESVVISSNTVAMTDSWAIYIEDWAEASGMVLANNSICNPVGYAMATDEGGPGANNTVVNNVACGLVEGFLPDTGQFWAGLGFHDYTDAEAWDFYPDHEGALLDVGSTLSEAWVPATDFNGAPREGSAPDIGAYEWSGEENPGWPISDGFKDLGYYDGPPPSVGGCCGDDQASGGEAVLLLPLLGLGALRRRRE